MHASARQVPEQEGVDGAESEFAALGPRTRAGHVIEDPRDLGSREVRIEQEARACRHDRFEAVGPQLRAAIGRATVLPDDRAMHRRAGRAIPDERRLALVRDADGRDRGRRHARSFDGRTRGRERRLPEVDGVVLDPAGVGKVLREFLLARASHAELRVEDDGPRARRALVDRQDAAVIAHDDSPPDWKDAPPRRRARS